MGVILCPTPKGVKSGAKILPLTQMASQEECTGVCFCKLRSKKRFTVAYFFWLLLCNKTRNPLGIKHLFQQGKQRSKSYIKNEIKISINQNSQNYVGFCQHGHDLISPSAMPCPAQNRVHFSWASRGNGLGVTQSGSPLAGQTDTAVGSTQSNVRPALPWNAFVILSCPNQSWLLGEASEVQPHIFMLLQIICTYRVRINNVHGECGKAKKKKSTSF